MATEAELRTQLAQRLDLVEPNLRLIGEEHSLDNKQGAAGFIDILARSDADGAYVVLELKRSNQASRQALHELEKYVTLLRANYGIGRQQIRCYVISTTWHELLVPLSEFKRDVDYFVGGKRILLNNNDALDNLDTVELDFDPPSREFCPHHIILCYADKTRRDADLERIEDASNDVGCRNYVISVHDYKGNNESIIHPFLIYFAISVLSATESESFANLLDEDDDELVAEEDEEAEDDTNDEQEDDEEEGEQPKWKLEDAVIEKIKKLHIQRHGFTWDSSEIGYPAKYAGLQEDWPLVALRRHGTWDVDRAVVSDGDVVNDLTVLDDNNPWYFVSAARSDHPLSWRRMTNLCLDSVAEVPAWRDGLREFFKCAERDHAGKLVRVWLYRRGNIFFDICAFLDRRDIDVTPSFDATIEDAQSNVIKRLRGVVEWDQRTVPNDPADDINEIYGSLQNMALQLHFAVKSDDLRALERLGLFYNCWELEPVDGGFAIHRFENNTPQAQITAVGDLCTVIAFIEANLKYCARLVQLIGQHTTTSGNWEFHG